MRNKKSIIILIVIILAALIIYIFKECNFHHYDINKKINEYNLNKEKDDYLNYLMQFIYPLKLREFVDNDSIAFGIYNDNATGEDVVNQMKFDGYKYLLQSLFYKERMNFDDCPVTEKFKNKFDKSLLDYFELRDSEDGEINCNLNWKEQNITIEVYGNLKNTEPTYWTTHHFHYTLDDEGNVDDVVFDYTEK